MSAAQLPSAELNSLFMDALREFLGLDTLSHYSFSVSAKKKHAAGKFKRKPKEQK